MTRGSKHSPQARAKIGEASRGRLASPEARAKIVASQTLRPPAQEIEAMRDLYAVMGLRRTAERIGYDRSVVRRLLREAGVPIRPPGRQCVAGVAPGG